MIPSLATQEAGFIAAKVDLSCLGARCRGGSLSSFSLGLASIRCGAMVAAVLMYAASEYALPQAFFGEVLRIFVERQLCLLFDLIQLLN